MSVLIRIIRHAARYPWRCVAALLLAITGTLLVLVLPAMTQRFIDDIVPHAKWDRILPTALWAVAAIATRQFLFTLRTLSNNSFEQRVVHDLRRTLYDRIQRLPVGWFDRQQTGDVMTRVAADVPAMERVIIEGIDQGLSGLIQFAIVLAFMFHQHAGLTLVTLAPMPLIAAVTWIYSRKVESRYRDASEASSSLHSLLHDNLAGIRQIKAYTSEPEELARFDQASERVRSSQLRVVRANAVTWPGVSLLAESGIVAMLAAASFWILKGQVTLGVVGSFLFAWGYLFDPLSRVNTMSQMLMAGIVAGKRVFAILDLAEETNLTDGARPAQLCGHVVFDAVTFSYAGKQPDVHEICIDARPGMTVALVGPTGAGKSTLIQLLAGFYRCHAGRILIDGEDLDGLSKEWWRDHVGYVTQESFLFNASIRDNLYLAKADASDEELWGALEAANAAGFTRALPDGLDTITGERGARLSGGERQRIAIARALLKNPPVLLLDEATSAVDTRTENLIQQAFDHLRADRTCFVIAHRLSTVRNADEICVMNEGRILERGRHEELVAAGGLYARLCEAGRHDPERAMLK